MQSSEFANIFDERGDDKVWTYFDYQLYTWTNGLGFYNQRAYDIGSGEFEDALAEFWSERAMNRRASRRRNLLKWFRLFRQVQNHFSIAHQSLAS